MITLQKSYPHLHVVAAVSTKPLSVKAYWQPYSVVSTAREWQGKPTGEAGRQERLWLHAGEVQLREPLPRTLDVRLHFCVKPFLGESHKEEMW